MCGIAGIAPYRDGSPPDPAVLRAMAAVQTHRGPDRTAVTRHGRFGLAHTRLSILDVAGGDQPLRSEDGRIAVVANGEIYGFRRLRAELEANGHRFATDSDCEVIVHLYEEHGLDAVSRLDGMFAFALVDERRQRLLLARDRIGKKPLYVADDGERVAFASELKALVAGGAIGGEVDPDALLLYLTYGYVPGPWTIFRGARKLAPGSWMTVDASGVRTGSYWQVPTEPEQGVADAEWEARLETALGDAVRRRLASDVPLGAFLSGGLDSGTVVSFMAEALDEPVRTETVGFDDPALDERDDAALAAAALGTDHRATRVTPALVDDLPRIAWHLDEPFADPSAVPTWYLCRATRERVTVALSGDGGDELFAGYPDRYGVHLLECRVRGWIPRGVRRRAFPALAARWPRSPRLPRALRLGTVFGNLAVEADRAYFRDRHLIAPDRQQALFGPALARGRRGFDPFAALAPHLAGAPADPLARVLHLDLSTWLVDDNLVKVDRMSMAHSLEVRCPLLDHRVVELAAAAPRHLKLHRGTTKVLLRRLAARRLPPELLRRPKRGFAPPVSRWLAHELYGFARERLLARGGLAASLFDRRALGTLLEDHRRRRVEAGWTLWTLLMLETWHGALAAAPSAIDREVAHAAGA